MDDTVIILRDECILIAEGKAGSTPKIQHVEQISIDSSEDPYEQWKLAVTEYKKRRNITQIKVVLPTSLSSSWVTKIPFARGRQQIRMAEHAVEKNDKNKVMDYGVISADREQGICLCYGGAEREDLKKLERLSQELELSVKSITVPMECYLNVLYHLEIIQKKTAIYLFFEDSHVISILLCEGQYLYSTKNRIFSEWGTIDFGTEIIRNISGILQFYATIKSETPITNVYFSGCSEEDFEISEEGLREMDLDIQMLRTGIRMETAENSGGWLVCAGALIRNKKKEINLQYNGKGKTEKKSASKRNNLASYLLYPIITFGICLVAAIGISVWNQETMKELSKIEDWMNDSRVQEAYQTVSRQKEESDRLEIESEQVSHMTDNLNTYPKIDAEMIHKIEDAGNSAMTVQIQTMDLESGIVTFHAVSKDVIDIPGYIVKLTDTGLFSSVNYSGYSYDNGEYSLMLSCVLKAVDAGGKDQ